MTVTYLARGTFCLTVCAAQATPAKLRPISAADFEHALDQVAPSSNTDSTSMNELQQWNSKYGEAAQRGYKAKLSYFI